MLCLNSPTDVEIAGFERGLTNFFFSKIKTLQKLTFLSLLFGQTMKYHFTLARNPRFPRQWDYLNRALTLSPSVDVTPDNISCRHNSSVLFLVVLSLVSERLGKGDEGGFERGSK